MGKYCAMRTCKYADYITAGVKRHRFPFSEDLQRKWEQFVIEGNRNTKFISHPTNFFTLCQRHFEPSCYNSSGSLRKDAVPTITDKFTPEVALKFGLIPSLKSELLENVNKFSSSIIKRVRTPEPLKNTDCGASFKTVEVSSEKIENIFGNSTMQLIVVDLGENISTTDTTSLLSRLPSITSPLRSNEIIILPKTSCRNPDGDAQTCACSCGCSPEQHNKVSRIAKTPKLAVKKFRADTGQLAMTKRDLRNVRRRYTRAMMKIETLSELLKQLKDKQRRRRDEEPQLDSCLYCKKALD